MKIDEIDETTRNLLKSHGVVYDSIKKVYMTRLHKDFFLKANEVESEGELIEFCELIKYLKNHLEYGLSTDWASSELNKYVYYYTKEELKRKFPSAIKALSRFYLDNDIVRFYEMQGATSPTIIDMIGTSGAGKTTFCQQFVDDESKEILKLTITEVAESTVIQTDILILEKTKRKMFLKVRNKEDIIKDILSVALEIDLKNKGTNIKESLKKNSDAVEKDIIDKVNNFYSTEKLFKEFISYAAKVQEKYKSEQIERFAWIQQNCKNDELSTILEIVVEKEFNTEYFYGYRQEYDLEENGRTKVITTLANYVFNCRKEELDEYPEMDELISYRLLFDHAILVLPCSDEAKEYLDYDFQQGIVLRDSQGHKLEEQNCIASDFEVKNKIFLIPVDNGGYLIDDRYSNLFEKILISEPKNSVFVLTKIDTINAYKAYKRSSYKENKAFFKTMRDKMTNTHNKLVAKFLSEHKVENQKDIKYKLYKDETILFKNFMRSFDNAYFSEIDEITYEAKAHKLDYCGNALEDINKDELHINPLESWFDIIGNILKQNKLVYHTNISRIADVMDKEQELIIKKSCDSINILINFYISQVDWEIELDEQLSVVLEDYRSIYSSAALWYYSNFKKDGNVTTYSSYFKDWSSNLIRNINVYRSKESNFSYLKSEVEKPLYDYLSRIYESKRWDTKMVIGQIALQLLNNSIEKAVKIAYKLYDRHLDNNTKSGNLEPIFSKDNNMYIKSTLNYEEVEERMRNYGTYTEEYLCIYCNLLSKFKYNLQTYFLDIFKIVLENELKALDAKVK